MDGTIKSYLTRAAKPRRGVAAREAALRQVTVLFADLKGSMELLADRGYKVYGGSASSDHVLLGERGVEHITYRCLPDTVDPRGPKGK